MQVFTHYLAKQTVKAILKIKIDLALKLVQKQNELRRTSAGVRCVYLKITRMPTFLRGLRD